MATEKQLAEARQWCDEARKRLKLQKYAKGGQKDLAARIKKVFSELAALDKGVQSGKFGLQPQDVDAFAQRMLAMSAALNEASRQNDHKEVERQSLRMSELKKELALALATSKGGRKKAQEKLDERAEGNKEINAYVDARDAAIEQVSDLGLHEMADAIEPELKAVERDLIAAAKVQADKGDYPAAMQLLARVDGACNAAKLMADEGAAYERALLSLQTQQASQRQHAQAAAGRVEFDQADQKVLAAAQRADLKTRDYAGARSLLTEAGTLNQAGRRMAERCQDALDARVPAADAVVQLGLHARAEAIRIPIETLGKQLVAADALAAIDKRQYDQAITAYQKVVSDAAAARGLADDNQRCLDALSSVQERVTEVGRHPQADAVASELETAAQAIAAAEQLAAPPTLDHAGAMDQIKAAREAADKAQALADECQQAIDAGNKARPLVQTLARLRKRFDSVARQLEVLEPKLAQADLKASKAQRDYKGAIALYRQIEQVAVVAQAQADKGVWDESLLRATQRLLEALQANSPERTRLEALWAVAQAQAEKNEHGEALKTLAKVRELATQALKSGPEQSEHGEGVRERTQALKNDIQLSAVLQLVDAFLQGPLPTAVELGKSFGGTAPAAWKNETDRIAGTLAFGRDVGLEAAQQALEQADKDLQRHEAAVRKLMQERSEWLERWGAYDTLYQSLLRHGGFSGSQPLIDRRTTNHTAAQLAKTAKADTLDFPGAVLDLAPCIVEARALVTAADASTQYQALRTRRQTEFTGAPASADQEAVDARTAGQNCLDEAAQHALAGRFPEAMRKLEEIPAHVARIVLVKNARRVYDYYRNNYVLTRINALETLAPKYKSHLATELDPLRAVVNLAKQQHDANQLIKASDTLSGVTYLTSAAEAMRDSVIDYVDTRVQFEPEYRKVLNHAGREGIDPFFQRLKADREFSDASARKREFKAATNILRPYLTLIGPQLVVAARYATYKTKKDETLRKIKVIKEMPQASLADSELARCDQYLQLADKQAASATALAAEAPLDAASTALDDALAAAEAGKATMEKVKALEDLKPVASGSPLEALRARVSAFAGMKSHVRGQAGDGSFDTLLNAAETQVQQADAALKLDTPDTGSATSLLDQADQALKDTLLKIARKLPYTTLLGTVEPLVSTTLPALNVPPTKCLDAELVQLGQLLQQAKDAAKAPGFDFAQGLAKLTEAQVLAGRCREKRTEFQALSTDRQVIKDQITAFDSPTFQPALAKELARLRKIETDTDQKLAAFDFAAARKLIADGKALKPAYDQLRIDYSAVITKRTNTYRDFDTKIAGKTMCKVEEDEYKLLKPQITKMIETDHAFAAADKLLTRIEYLVYIGQQEIGHYKKYSDPRRLVAARLPAARQATNDGVRELIAHVESELQRADAAANRRECVQALAIIEPLKDVLDTISEDAPLFDAWASARDTCAQRAEAAKNHAQAEFIKPLRELAETKRRAAADAAGRREFVAARKLADEAAASLAQAILSANGYTEFSSLVGGTDQDDAPKLREALTRLDDKITAVTENVPPAEQLPGAVAAARTAAASAKKLLDEGKTAGVAQLLEDGGKRCAEAEVHKLQWTQVRQQQTAALQLVDGFTGGSHAAKAFVADRMAATRKQIESATQTMVAQGSAAATAVLTQAVATYRADVLLADRRKAYDTERLKLEPSGAPSVLETLERHAHRYAASKEIETLRSKLGAAAAAAGAATPDFDLAMRALKEADAAAAAGRLAISLIPGGTPPTVDDISKVLAQPEGIKKVDEMVRNLDPATQRDVLQKAFKARFGCELKIFKGGVEDSVSASFGVDVAHFYGNFAKLPEKHTLKNDQLMIVDDYRSGTSQNYGDTSGPAKSSDFASWHRKLSMRDGGAAASAGRDLGAEHALGNVPEEYKPANDDPVLFLDWNTLHEAGHAVDGKYGFMTKNGSQSLYGGWTDYGMDTNRVAAKLVTEFDYDRAYIADLLGGVADPAIPDPPNGVSYEEWERRRQRVRLWAENARSGKNPWESDATAQALKLKTGEIIHEAYGGQWYGYLASERSKGITGYQFRSPLEWFSEIYAAYYSKKLKPGHPAAAWLANLADANVA